MRKLKRLSGVGLACRLLDAIPRYSLEEAAGRVKAAPANASYFNGARLESPGPVKFLKSAAYCYGDQSLSASSVGLTAF